MSPIGRWSNSTLLTGALALLALACAGCPVWDQQDTPVPEFAGHVPGTSVKYYLYVPSQYTSTRLYPLVVTMHGTPGFDGPKAQVREWKALAERNDFIVLAPKLTSVQGVLPVFRFHRLKQLARDEANVLAAIRHVKRKYSIDDRAVMITGFSAGGYPLYYIGLRNADQFTVLTARLCNFDLRVVRSIPLTDAVRKMPMLLYSSKTGINPLYSSLNPVSQQTWAAFRHLRLEGCHKVERRSASGGHHRRPDMAWAFFSKHLPPEYRRARRGR